MREMKDNKYAKRLIEEWEQHGKIIIAVDYDDTLRTWRLNDQKECDKHLQKIRDAQLVGAYIVVFTACNSDRHDEIRNYLESRDLKVDSINSNPIDLPYGNHSKVYANIFIDDRAGIDEALEILEWATVITRSNRHRVTEQTVEF